MEAFNKVGKQQEVSSQYRKVRLLAYVGVALVSSVSALIYIVRLLSFVADPVVTDYNDAIADVGVNLFALALVAVLFNVDKLPEEKLLAKTEEGGALATLRVRFNTTKENMMVGTMRTQDRKEGKRVVIVACNAQSITEYVQGLKAEAGALLEASDVVVVPVALPMTRASTIDQRIQFPNVDKDLFTAPYLASPNGGDWVSILGSECELATEAGILPVEYGFSIVIEKDGRIGRRIPGLPSVEDLFAPEEETV
jgi:uncharacterized membrane protein YqjE